MRSSQQPFRTAAAVPQSHSVSVDQSDFRRALGLPEGARLTSVWIDLRGTVTVSYEEPMRTGPPPLQTFYTEAQR